MLRFARARRCVRATAFLTLAALAPLAALAACDAGFSARAPSSPSDAADAEASPGDDANGNIPDAPSDDDGGDRPLVRFDDGFARAAHARPLGGWVVLLERPVHIRERQGHPDRRVVFLDAHWKEEAHFEPAAGRELLDVAVHTSGEVTALEASDDGYYLVRLSPNGERLRETLLVDDAIYTDPPKMNPGESRSRIETSTHDTGRVVASTEGVLVATRTGRHSVVAYAVAFDPAVGYTTSWRSLVVPAHSIWPVGLTGGSYDTFGQLDAHFAVHLARDAAGIVYVGVQHARADSGALVHALESVFGESIAADPDFLDTFVTRISHQGTRLGLSVVGTAEDDQLYGLRAGESGAIAVGRSELWNEQGTGFEALVGHVDADGHVTIDRFDVDRSDIAFDATRTRSGAVVVVGASGYSQNPHGASISEESAPFGRARVDGGASGKLTLPSGPRHGEARFVLPIDGGRLLVGGMLDGPGTHSADGDPSLLRARGFLTVVDAP